MRASPYTFSGAGSTRGVYRAAKLSPTSAGSRCPTRARPVRSFGGIPGYRRRTAKKQRCGAVSITCMGNQVRQARVSKQLERELGRILVSDKVVAKALRPPGGKDCMASITDVWVSGDLQVAKIQVSLYNANGDDLSRRFEKLEPLSGYIRKLVGQRMHLKQTPELRFFYNEDFQQMFNALEALRLRGEREGDVMSDAQTEPDIETLEKPVASSKTPVSDSEPVSDSKEEEEEEEEEEGDFVPFQQDSEDVGLAFADMFPEPSQRRNKGFGRKKKPKELSGNKTIESS
ncbi:hypothetical protein BSKO_13228 [Bryopsis sp. KO-2023]|nr:hypothetical protein BSKO_13228 [Bryopsis sp. KO-2023]